MRRLSSCVLCAGIIMVVFHPICRGKDFDRTFESLPQSVEINNAGQKDIPTLFLVGETMVDGDSVRHTKGLSVNGVRLCDTLLSKSVLILRPNGKGIWGYRLGLDAIPAPIHIGGIEVDGATLMEYGKWKYDPMKRPTITGGSRIQAVQLADPKGNVRSPLSYRISFPDAIRIKSIRINGICWGLGGDAEAKLHVQVFDGTDSDKVLAGQSFQDRPPFSCQFALDSNSIILSFSCELKSPPGKEVKLARVLVEAELDTQKLPMPVLEPGNNTLTFSDDPDSSHQARIVVNWNHKPQEKDVWEDFEDNDSLWVADQKTTVISEVDKSGLCSPFTGSRFLRVRLTNVCRA